MKVLEHEAVLVAVKKPPPAAAKAVLKEETKAAPKLSAAEAVNNWYAETLASMPNRLHYAPELHVQDCLPKLIGALGGNS